MITQADVQKEINSLIAEFEPKRTKPEYRKEYNQAGDRIRFLRHCLAYLESSPREELLSKQLEQLDNKMKRIQEGFSKWLEHQPRNDGKSDQQFINQYNTQMETAKIRKQIKTLKFILS